MLRATITGLAFAVAVAVVLAQPPPSQSIFTIRQDQSTGIAELALISIPFGDVRIISNLTFAFENPLVECTVDGVNRLVYVVTIDTTSGGSILYQLDERLNLVQTWTTPSTNDFFDLQYNTHQSALYGISVVSRYGRVLSNFTLGAPGVNANVSVAHLVSMPMGWYVNASSFDTVYDTDRYFALINQFPGNANWTDGQQLVVADFSGDTTPAPAQFFTLPTTSSGGGGILHYIGFDASQGGGGGRSVWGLSVGPGVSNPSPQALTLVSVNVDTGDYTPVADFVPPNPSNFYDIGPMIVHTETGNPWFFCRDTAGSGLWMLVMFDAARDQQFHIIRKFMDSQKAFRAVAYAPW